MTGIQGKTESNMVGYISIAQQDTRGEVQFRLPACPWFHRLLPHYSLVLSPTDRTDQYKRKRGPHQPSAANANAQPSAHDNEITGNTKANAQKSIDESSC